MSLSATCFTPLMKQAWLSSGVWIIALAQGLSTGYMSCLLLALQQPDSPIKTDLHSASWLASALAPSQMIGFMTACSFINWLGRRRGFLLLILPGTLGCLIIYLAQSYMVLFIARVLSGITLGTVSAVGVLIIAEYADPKHRGMFMGLKTSFSLLGHTIVHILGKFLSWRTIAIFTMISHILGASIVYTWPESPSWLASKGKFTRCEKTFLWLRGTGQHTIRELKELIEAHQDRELKLKSHTSFTEKSKIFLRQIKNKAFMKPLLIVCTGFMLLESSLKHVFNTYALQITGGLIGTKSLPFYYTLGIDLVITVSSMFSSILLRYLKYRTLLFYSGVSALTTIVLACIYLFLASHNILSNERHWIPVLLFSLFFLLENLGCVPLPFIFLGELFSLSHKATATAFVGIWKTIVIMLSLKLTPYLIVNIKLYGTFIVFASIMSISLLILYFILPETKDRTLQEIEDYFNYGQFTDKRVRSDDQVRDKMINNEQL